MPEEWGWGGIDPEDFWTSIQSSFPLVATVTLLEPASTALSGGWLGI
jgi:hypothetical protein